MNDNKLKGTMYIGESLCIGGPKIAERLKAGETIRIDDHGQSVEFALRVENRLTDKIIEAAPFVGLADAEVNITAEPDFEGGTLCVVIEAGEGRDLELFLNVEQAIELQDIMENFIKGYEGASGLRKERHVDAPEEEDDNTKSAAARPS